MVVRLGLLVEGEIDEELVWPLLRQVVGDLPPRRSLEIERFLIPSPPGGFGEIPKTLRTLTRLYEIPSERSRINCNLFVIVHDSRKTSALQREINRILRSAASFPAVYGLAIQEVEAWVLGDID